MATKTIKNIQTSPDKKNTITTYSDGSTSFSGPKSSGGGGKGVQVATDPKTGAALRPTTNIQEAYSQAVSTPIAVDKLGTKSVDIPTVDQFNKDTTNYSALLNGLGSTATSAQDYLKTLKESSSNQADLFKQFSDLIGTPPSTADAYLEAQKQSKILKAQQEVSNLSSQLGQITSAGQAAQLSVVGQGRGIPEAIIGGQQAQIGRETAIAALPVAAQLQAAQGNLEMAQQNLNTLFQIKSADMQAQYQYKTNLVKGLYDLASKQEQSKLDYALKLEDRAYQQSVNNQTIAQQWAKAAIDSGQSSLAGRISSLDVKSPTFAKDLASLQSQIASGVSKAADTVKTDTGTFQWNPATQKYDIPVGGASVSAPDSAKLVVTNDISNVLADPNLESTFGLKNVIYRNVPGTPQFNLSLKVDNIINQLALAARGQLKGQGAVSDFEGKMLKSAQTALNINTTPEQAKQELTKVRGAILTSSGLSAPVKITAPDGTSKIGSADQKTINDAIASGYRVEYQ